MLAAPPKVLGVLRRHLHKEVTSKSAAEVPRDLTCQPLPVIAGALSA